MAEEVIRIEVSEDGRGVPGRIPPGVPPRVPKAPPKIGEVLGKTFLSQVGLGGLVAKAGVALGLIGVAVGGIMFLVAAIKRSKIFSAYMNSFITIFGAFIEMMMIPLIPLFNEFLRGFLSMYRTWRAEGLWGLLKMTPKDIFGPTDVWIDLPKVIGDFFRGKLSFWDLVSVALGGFFAGPVILFWRLVLPEITKFFSGPFIDFWIMIGKAIGAFFSGPFVDFWVMIGSAVASFFSGPFVDFWVMIGGAIARFFSGPFVDFWVMIGRAIVKFFSGPFVDFWVMVGREIVKFFTGTIPDFWKMVTGAIGDFFGVGRPGGIAWWQAGTPYVPSNMLAYLHKGEAVIPASQNVFNFAQNFTYSSPTSYLAGREMQAGFGDNLTQTLLRLGV